MCCVLRQQASASAINEINRILVLHLSVPRV